ncbi:MAG: hypothetical protein ACI9Y8_000715 [Candidatus Omnitrophota bacterium]|jgi:hypothetical protein
MEEALNAVKDKGQDNPKKNLAYFFGVAQNIYKELKEINNDTK